MGQFEQGVFGDARALLHTLALFLGHNLKGNCQTALSKLTLRGGPFETSGFSPWPRKRRRPSAGSCSGRRGAGASCGPSSFLLEGGTTLSNTTCLAPPV